MRIWKFRREGRFGRSLNVVLGFWIASLMSSGAQADGFGRPRVWHPSFGNSQQILLTGDFNNDKRADMASFSRDSEGPGWRGDVWVSLSTRTGGMTTQKWHDFISVSQQIPKIGDFNGDGKDDVVNFIQDTYSGDARGDVEVALSDGTRFLESQTWNGWFSIGTEVPDVGDFNGDGLDDIVTFVRDGGGAGYVWVALSNGSSFGPGQVWSTSGCVGAQIPVVGDFTGDRKADIGCFIQSTQGEPGLGDVYVLTSNGSQFTSKQKWHEFFSVNNEIVRIGDFNGDGRDDIATFVGTAPGFDNGNVWVSFSNGTSFSGAQLWQDEFCVTTRSCLADDFNGDGRDDIVAFSLETAPVNPGYVYVALTADPSPEIGYSQHESFGYQALKRNGNLNVGGRPLVVALVDFSDRQFDATHTKAYFRSLITGFSFPTLKFYYQEISAGLFRWDVAGIYGVYRYPNDPGTTPNESRRICAYNYPVNSTTQCPGSSSDEYKMRAWAIQQTARSVDYKSYDKNNDGRVTDDEVGFLMINASAPNDHSGGTRGTQPGCVRVGAADRQVDVCVGVPDMTGTASLMTMAHELMHPMGGFDLYNTDGQNFAISLFGPTIVSNADDRSVYHLDPWQKMTAGWIRPRVYSIRDPGSCAFVESAQYGGTSASKYRRPLLFFDPRLGKTRYFLVEYRDSTAIASGQYDSNVASNGLAIWNVAVESPTKLTSPLKVPSLYINGGANGRIDSLLAWGSDDRVSDTNGDGVQDLISAGADMILQTAPSGDDVNPLEFMVTHWGAPNWVRGGNSLWTHAHGQLKVPWWNRSDSGFRIRTAPGPRAGVIAVRWGWADLKVPPKAGFIADAELRDCMSRF